MKRFELVKSKTRAASSQGRQSMNWKSFVFILQERVMNWIVRDLGIPWKDRENDDLDLAQKRWCWSLQSWLGSFVIVGCCCCREDEHYLVGEIVSFGNCSWNVVVPFLLFPPFGTLTQTVIRLLISFVSSNIESQNCWNSVAVGQLIKIIKEMNVPIADINLWNYSLFGCKMNEPFRLP